MAALTGLLGDYGSDDESAGSDHEAVGARQSQGYLKLSCNRPGIALCKTAHMVFLSCSLWCAAASIDDVELTESGVASSRPASALPADVDAAPEVADDRALPEANTVMSPDQPSQFQLPPDIAEPPDQLCSAAVQVGSNTCFVVQSLHWHHLVASHTGKGGEAVMDTEPRAVLEC